MLVACVNTLKAVASESTLQSPIERSRGKVAKGKSDLSHALHLMYAIRQNPVLKWIGAHFYRTKDTQKVRGFSLYPTKVCKLY